MKKVVLVPGIIAFLAIIMSGCSAYNTINVTQADGVDFRKAYHTYRWLPIKSDTLNTAYDNEIIRNNIKSAFDKQLKERKMHIAVDDASADLSLQLIVQTNNRVRDNARFVPGFYFGPFGASYSTSRSYYAHNQITLNMFDRKTSHLVWTCTAEGDLSNPKELAKNIEPVVAKIMKKYPVAVPPKTA